MKSCACKDIFPRQQLKKRSRRLKSVVTFLIGLTPYISNEVGMFADTKMSKLNGSPRNAVAGGHKTQMHRVGYYEEDPEAKVAFPNDRAQSIRPEHDKYK